MPDPRDTYAVGVAELEAELAELSRRETDAVLAVRDARDRYAAARRLEAAWASSGLSLASADADRLMAAILGTESAGVEARHRKGDDQARLLALAASRPVVPGYCGDLGALQRYWDRMAAWAGGPGAEAAVAATLRLLLARGGLAVGQRAPPGRLDDPHALVEKLLRLSWDRWHEAHPVPKGRSGRTKVAELAEWYRSRAVWLRSVQGAAAVVGAQAARSADAAEDAFVDLVRGPGDAGTVSLRSLVLVTRRCEALASLAGRVVEHGLGFASDGFVGARGRMDERAVEAVLNTLLRVPRSRRPLAPPSGACGSARDRALPSSWCR